MDPASIAAALAAKKTKKKATACDICYKLRRKCDAATPMCGPCQKSSASCTYIRRFVSPSLIQRRAKKDTSAYAQQLEQRLATMETAVRSLIKNVADEAATTHSTTGGPSPLLTVSSNVTANNTPPSSSVSPFSGMDNSPFASNGLPNIDTYPFAFEESLLDSAFPSKSYSGVLPPSQISPASTESAASSLVDLMEEAFDTKLMLRNGPQNLDDGDHFTEAINNICDPKREDNMILINRFFSQVNASMPQQFINEAVFRYELQNNIDPCPSLNLIMCAIAEACGPNFVFDGTFWPFAGFEPSNSTSGGESTASERFFELAIASLDFDKPSVKMCQALLLMIPMLRMDVDPDTLEQAGSHSFTWAEKETRRRIYVVSVSFDMYDLIYRERCVGIWRKSADVKIPQINALWNTVNPVTGEPTLPPPENRVFDVTYYFYTFGSLIARITDYNISVKSKMKNVAVFGMTSAAGMETNDGPISEFASVDKDLKAFFSSLPPRFRSLDIYDRFSVGKPSTEEEPSYLLIKLHLFMHGSMLFLHRNRMIQGVIVVIKNRTTQTVTSVGGPNRFQGGMSAMIFNFMDSIRTCAHAANAIIKIIGKEIEMVSSTSLFPMGKQPAVCLFGVGECRAILEAALYFLIVTALLKGNLNPTQLPHEFQPLFASADSLSEVKDHLPSILGCDLKSTSSSLRLAVDVLISVSQRWKIVEPMAAMLLRLMNELGLERNSI
ncbi:hypothetical protein HDU97_000140 [Phlyctochytrium planicorne]|nr:hypothetical protein HDU97_000140 [Phlyctochytrium planicorne]